ncbi:MAG: tRNA (adenosine(37)-N6)-threonylcarbamoyltransferase complex ATPase subunit type 1 TsaE [Pseudomonadota bacterium]
MRGGLQPDTGRVDSGVVGEHSDTRPVDGIFLAEEAATTRLGASLADTLGAGDTLLLEGPIGAGKSHLARALIQAAAHRAGLPAPDVPSPTYTLVQSYALGGLEIVHADLYRLSDPSELAELGLEDAFGMALCLIEWPDRLGDYAPPNAIRARLRVDGSGRRVSFATEADAESQRIAAMLRAGGFL